MSLCKSDHFCGRTMDIQYIQPKESLGKLLYREDPAHPVSNSDLRGMRLRPKVWISSRRVCDSDEVFLKAMPQETLSYSKK